MDTGPTFTRSRSSSSRARVVLLLRALITSVPRAAVRAGQTCGEDKARHAGRELVLVAGSRSRSSSRSRLSPYNAAAKDVPTKDSVFVNIDLSINLKIGPDLQRGRTLCTRWAPSGSTRTSTSR